MYEKNGGENEENEIKSGNERKIELTKPALQAIRNPSIRVCAVRV